MSRETAAKHLVLSPSQRAEMLRQLAVALQARLPLVQALQVVGRQITDHRVRQITRQLVEQIKSGQSFSTACDRFPRVFDKLAVSLVRVGEQAGMLSQSLDQLAGLAEHQQDIRNSIVTACIYPIFVLVLGLISILIVVVWILPRMMTTLAVDPALFPWPTALLMSLSDLLQRRWYLCIGVIVILWLAGRLIVKSRSGQAVLDHLKLKTPWFGDLHRKWAVSRFTRTLGTLLKGGVNILDAFTVVRDTLGNEVMARDVDAMIRRVRGGSSLAGALPQDDRYPPLLQQIFSVGEETGKLPQMLLDAAAAFEKDTALAVKRVMAIFPAILILLLALVVGFIVAATILPIVRIETSIPGF